MTDTTKYILLGGAVALGVFFIAKRLQPPQEQKSPASQLLDSGSKLVDSVRGLVSSFTSPSGLDTGSTGTGGIPYGGSASDGTAAVSDATGSRIARAYVPAQQTYLTEQQRALGGIA